MDNGRLRVFLKDPLMKELGIIFSFSKHQLRKMMELLRGHSHLKGLADTPGSEMHSCI